MTKGNGPVMRATVTIDGHTTTTEYPLDASDLRVIDRVLAFQVRDRREGLTGGDRHYEIRRHDWAEGSLERRILEEWGFIRPGEKGAWSILWDLAQQMRDHGSPDAARLFFKFDEGDDALIIDIDPYEKAA